MIALAVVGWVLAGYFGIQNIDLRHKVRFWRMEATPWLQGEQREKNEQEIRDRIAGTY